MIRAAHQLGYNEIDLNDLNQAVGDAVQQNTIRFVNQN